jgi:hypothetical protein
MLKDGRKMLREIKGLVTLNALDRDAEIDYVRERSRRGHKSGYGKRWRLVMRLKRRLDIVKHLSKSAER